MTEEQARKKPLRERIEDKIKEKIGDFVEALEDLLSPPPEPVRIPVRRHPRYRR